MAYNRVNWKNGASGGTPVGATNLNIMDEGIANNDTEIEKLKTDKADKTEIPDVSTFATKEELGAKADKSEIPDVSGLMPKSGGTFTDDVVFNGDDGAYFGAKENGHKIDSDGIATLEIVRCENLEGDLTKNRSLTDDILSHHSVGRDGYTYDMLVASRVPTFYTNWDDNEHFPGVFGSGQLIPCLDGSMKVLTFQNSEGAWVKTIRPQGGTLTEWKSITEGGGGGEAEWTGTKAEYEADKDNIPEGMIVNITDDYVEPTSGGGGGIVYSFDEVVVGTYLGKPLYGKMCDFGVSYAIATTYKVITPSLIPTDMDIVPNASVFMITNDRSVRFVSPVTIYCENGSWKFKSIGEWSASANRHVYMYIEYTKTTD